MLCDECHQREATAHICSFDDGVKQVRDLCPDCLESSTTPEAAGARTMRDARCDFCGAPATTGGTNVLALCAGEEAPTSYMCWECSQEFNRYSGHITEKMPDDLSQEQQLAAFRQLRQETERHMKDWVSQRSKGRKGR
jgi:protein-arginine kinase activator protein McsA